MGRPGRFSMAFRSSLNWKIAKETLDLYLKLGTTVIKPIQQFRCYFVLGKIAEKQNPPIIQNVLENYLCAEQQLFDCEDDVALLPMKIEINFRITASIYKYLLRAENVMDEHVFTLLMTVLKRDKSRIFNDSQLATRSNNIETIDENANKVNMEHQSQVSIRV